MHPILDAMLLTEHEWLRNLVYVFNEGDIRKFDALTPLFGKEVRFPSLLMYLIPHSLLAHSQKQ